MYQQTRSNICGVKIIYNNVGRAIKYTKNQAFMVLGAAVISLVVVLIGFLVVEYRFFKHQSCKVLDIRDDYRNYLTTIKRFLTERNKEKTSTDHSSSAEEEKKVR